MVEDSVLNEILERACPYIKYRIRLELMNQPRLETLILDLQRQILDDPAVQEVFSWRQPDGWLAWDFHGYQSTEAGIRLLCEKSADPCHSVLCAALQVLARETGRLARGIGKVGRILDQCGLGGSQTIRAVVSAYAGSEDRPFVKEQIDVALGAFRAV